MRNENPSPTVKEILEAEIGGKRIRIFRNEQDGVPAVYASTSAEAGEAVLARCAELGCKPFHLVTVSDLRWDEELSPWPHAPILSKNDRFTGEADLYARFLESRVVPYAEDRLGPPPYRVIAGYSMAGLFALYAPHITDLFSAAVSASGSVWYPDFLPYVRSHIFRKRPDAVYLSLGDLESRTRNPYFRQTEGVMRALDALYREQRIRSVFELNPGSHFRDAELRLAKGIAWILEQCGTAAPAAFLDTAAQTRYNDGKESDFGKEDGTPMNTILSAMENRISTRGYTAEKLTQQELDALIAAGLQAPTAANRQEIHFTVLSGSDPLLAEIEQEKNALAGIESPAHNFYYEAPTVIILSGDKNNSWSPIDAGIAVQNIALAAEGLGLGSVILGCIKNALNGEKEPYFSKALRFPENYGYFVAIAVGHKNATKAPHEYSVEKNVTVL